MHIVLATVFVIWYIWIELKSRAGQNIATEEDERAFLEYKRQQYETDIIQETE